MSDLSASPASDPGAGAASRRSGSRTAPTRRPTASRDRVGSLVGVGLGPGDPELITLKGLRAIEAADVVFVPTRRDEEPSYALTIAGDLIDPQRQAIVTLPFPVAPGRDGWRERCRPILAELAGGRRGVFLTEGDPSLYSAFGHIRATLRRLEPELAVDVIPGVSSVTAAAAAAGLSLADYGERVAILPASYALDRLESVLAAFECVVLLKVGSVLHETLDLLERIGLLESAIYVRRCGRPEQQVVHDLRRLQADPPRDYFALIVVRKPA